MLLDDEDYDNIGITNRVHIRKIRVEMDRIYHHNPQQKIQMSLHHQQRRETIRKQKKFHYSAIKIQTQFRRFAAQKELILQRELSRLHEIEIIRQRKIDDTAIWWTNHKMLPSRKQIFPLIGSNGIKLPPIKTFGRYRDHLSHRGWTRRAETFLTYHSVHDINNSKSHYDRYFHGINQMNTEYMSRKTGDRPAFDTSSHWLPTAAALLDRNFQGESSPTLIYSEKLYRNGYDNKRLQKFLLSQS
jgi:hypothetical protein